MNNRMPQFFALLLLPLAAFAADKINMRPGLWESTTTVQSQGAPPISAEQKAMMDQRMASLSPDMRARIEAAQKKGKANSAQPHVHKSCVTKEDLDKPLTWGDGKDDGKCTKTVLKSTSMEQEIRVECASDKYKSSGTFHVILSNPETYSGTMVSTITPAGGSTSMTSTTKITGKWLGASCGDVKPRPEK
jgi:hypothetical protein